MTAFAAAASQIRARMNANFTAAPIAWENAPHQPNDDAFVFFEVVSGGSEQVSIGSPNARLYRHAGVIQAHVFVPTGKGTKLALEHADTIAAIFRGQSFNGVLCFAPRLGNAAQADDDGKWYRVTVSIPFQYDAIF